MTVRGCLNRSWVCPFSGPVLSPMDLRVGNSVLPDTRPTCSSSYGLLPPPQHCPRPHSSADFFPGCCAPCKPTSLGLGAFAMETSLAPLLPFPGGLRGSAHLARADGAVWRCLHCLFLWDMVSRSFCRGVCVSPHLVTSLLLFFLQAQCETLTL